MTASNLARRDFLRAMTAAGASCLAAGACGSDGENDLREPVHRVAKANNPPPAAVLGQVHPLDPALDMARDALKQIDQNVVDYTCLIVKQQRIRGQLGEQEFMDA